MPHDLAGRIEYSEKYLDDKHEYRHVFAVARRLLFSRRYRV